jgi:alkyl hydroperoxide reductase subunit AhpF
MQPGMLNEEICAQIKQIFAVELDQPVELIYFFDKDKCVSCEETRQLLDELVTLSGKLSLSVVDLDRQPELGRQYNIHHAPALVLAGRDHAELVDYGIRFYGIPSGYEFGSLIHSIQLVSKRDSGLKPSIRSELKDIRSPLLLKIFVTPT